MTGAFVVRFPPLLKNALMRPYGSSLLDVAQVPLRKVLNRLPSSVPFVGTCVYPADVLPLRALQKVSGRSDLRYSCTTRSITLAHPPRNESPCLYRSGAGRFSYACTHGVSNPGNQHICMCAWASLGYARQARPAAHLLMMIASVRVTAGSLWSFPNATSARALAGT